ncbi:MAG: GTP 3',8-cyclase MoaA [Desulfuromonadales bacterium]
MNDKHGRNINYLRLSVTDRCNLRCCYCMPAEGVPSCSHADILRYEDLLCIAEAAADLGIEKVRVTGGEPLVRKGIDSFLAELGTISGISEIVLTTNGLLLQDASLKLKSSGVDRLNVSLDSLDPRIYRRITRGGDFEQVLAGLEAAEKAGLRLKLNMVVMRGINDHEIEEFAALSLDRPWSVRFIEYMPSIRESQWQSRLVPGSEIFENLQHRFNLLPIAKSPLCGPARSYRIPDAAGTVGIVTPISDHFCSDCNRIRVTSRGLAKSCLLSRKSLDLRPVLGQGLTEVREALASVIDGKSDRHHFMDDQQGFQMSCIGG